MAVLTCTSAHRTPWKAVVLLWLSGNGLRLTILAVPPVIATIRDDLHLSATEVGLLGSIAPAMFAIAALVGSLLVQRLGVVAALAGSLALVAAGSALRGLSPNYAVLLLTTVVMSAGVIEGAAAIRARAQRWRFRRSWSTAAHLRCARRRSKRRSLVHVRRHGRDAK